VHKPGPACSITGKRAHNQPSMSNGSTGWPRGASGHPSVAAGPPSAAAGTFFFQTQDCTYLQCTATLPVLAWPVPSLDHARAEACFHQELLGPLSHKTYTRAAQLSAAGQGHTHSQVHTEYLECGLAEGRAPRAICWATSSFAHRILLPQAPRACRQHMEVPGTPAACWHSCCTVA